MTANAIVVLAGYLITVGAVLLWVCFSAQKCVPRTVKTAVGISLRTLPLFVVLPIIILIQIAGVLGSTQALRFSASAFFFPCLWARSADSSSANNFSAFHWPYRHVQLEPRRRICSSIS